MILYITEWFNSSSSIKAPLQDLTFIKNILRSISECSLTVLWSLMVLSAELCAFAFFDEDVPLDRGD